MDCYPTSDQRKALLELAEALGSRKAALHRDQCDDWRISGSHGHVYAVPGVAGERATLPCTTLSTSNAISSQFNHTAYNAPRQ
jgi:hypothetical protein